jgi:LuxR family transcriptional regulator, maltose regulon positive regulatory protein
MQKPGKFLATNAGLQTETFLIAIGSSEWFAWLSQHTRFSYQGKNGHFTARRETRRNKTFWYAYRRRTGKLYKQYLGKSDELTIERLEQVSLALAGKQLFAEYDSQPAREAPSSDEPRIHTSFLPSAKFKLPVPPPHLIARPRLTEMIKTPLTLVYAPSGFGKTTLLNDWSRSCDHPAAWLSLDENDNHAVHFWISIILAFQTIQPDFGADLLAYLKTAASVYLPDAVSVLTSEIVSMEAAFPRMSLVLDDFHVTNRPDIIPTIQVWLEHFPANLQLILSGHTKPPLSLGHLRARGLLTELDAGDLRFTVDEGIYYLQQYQQGSSLAYTDLEKLVRHSEGWAAGLTLAALALGKQEDQRQFIDTFNGAHIYLREFFMETVLQRTSPEVQQFLLKTAVLKNLNGKLCDAITQQTGGEAMLEHLWQENLFTVRLEKEGWYRYHDLFAEMLLSQLQARFPDEAHTLHQRAAQWYREQNAPADAVVHLLAINAWEEAATLIETMALRELEEYGEDSRLLRWLQELPEMVVQKHKTLLLVYLRLADVALPKQKIERFVANIETDLSSKPVPQQTPDEREVLAEIQRIRRAWEQGDVYMPLARINRETDSRWEVLNGLHLLRRVYDPNPEAFESQAGSLLHKAQAQHNLFVILMAGGVLAGRALASGQLRRSEKIARQVLEQALAQRGKLPEPASIALAALSQVSLERNELDLAQRYLSQAQQVDPNPTSSNMLVQTGILRSRILLAQGKANEALSNIQSIRAVHTRRPSGMWTDQDLLSYQALINLHLGEISTARQLLSAAESAGEHPLSKLVQAEILLLENRPAAAEEWLSDLVRQYPNGIYAEPLMRARVLLALAFFAQYKMNQALQTITEALRLAAPEGFYRPFLENSAKCSSLLRLALNTQRLTADTQNFIKEILRSEGCLDEYALPKIEELTTSASISRREQEVLDLLGSGHSNRAIAEKLCISESTVKTHLGKLYDKLGVNSRTQAIKRAKELKLVR